MSGHLSLYGRSMVASGLVWAVAWFSAGVVVAEPATLPPQALPGGPCHVITPGTPPGVPAVVPGTLQVLRGDVAHSPPDMVAPAAGSLRVLTPPKTTAGDGLQSLAPTTPPEVPANTPAALQVLRPMPPGLGC